MTQMCFIGKALTCGNDDLLELLRETVESYPKEKARGRPFLPILSRPFLTTVADHP